MPPGLEDASSRDSAGDAGADPAADPAVRHAILRAALTVAQHRGYHGTTLHRVAATAGVAPEKVSAEFADRGVMLRAALELAFQDWYDEVPTWKEVEPLPDLQDEIERRLVGGVAAGRRAADFWRLGLLLSLEPALAGSDITEVFVDVRERTRTALHDYWSRVVPGSTAGASELVEVAVRGHLALLDGSMLATHGTPDWDLEGMMSLVATGIASVLDRSTASDRVER